MATEIMIIEVGLLYHYSVYDKNVNIRRGWVSQSNGSLLCIFLVSCFKDGKLIIYLFASIPPIVLLKSTPIGNISFLSEKECFQIRFCACLFEF
jgi:hypothetical protein